jgi:nucleoside-diphosphate-sugar epimerase
MSLAPTLHTTACVHASAVCAPRAERSSRVLVLGGAGYLGSVTVGQLLARGFAVRVMDLFLFGDRSLLDFKRHPNFTAVKGDVRDRATVERLMKDCDAVIHLAAIVGDAACEKQKELAQEVNCDATAMLADVAQGCGVRRFIFASSCSVYGVSDRILDETSAVNPLSVYARTKVDSELRLLAAKSVAFAPTVLRLGTLFGVSPRMRFDLIVNLFAAQAACVGRITVWNGEQWRPFVHVADASRAFVDCLCAEPEAVSGEIFNVGSAYMNCQIRRLGDEIVRLIPQTRVSVIKNGDRRDYRVSFEKIRRVLGFQCERNLAFGIRETYDLLGANSVGYARAKASRPDELQERVL